MMPNIALEIRLDLSSIEEYQVLYVQNCLWKMNSRRYEAPSSKTVVITVAALYSLYYLFVLIKRILVLWADAAYLGFQSV